MKYDATDYYLLGGGTRYKSGEIGGAIDFGFRPSDKSLLQTKVPAKGGARALFEPVRANEDVPSVQGDAVLLWQWVRFACSRLTADQKKAFAVHDGLPALNWQLTGSCVNGGAYNALLFRLFCEIAVLPQAEAPSLPFTLMAYGQSRYDAFGWSTPGEGSMGDAMARALATIGAAPMDTPGLPAATHCGPAVCYSRAEELEWSSIRNHPASVKAAAKPYTITYGVVTNPDEAEAELRRLRPLTWAGDWGGQNRGVVNSDGLLVMPRRESWGHQQSVIGMLRIRGVRWWRVQNQWFSPSADMGVEWVRVPGGEAVSRITRPGIALPVHGDNPDAGYNGPAGGYWITDNDMAYQCRYGEVRSIRSFNGYPGEIDLARI